MVVFHILLDINMHELPVIKLQWRAEHLLVWNEKGQKTLPGEALRRSWPEECVELPDHMLPGLSRSEHADISGIALQ